MYIISQIIREYHISTVTDLHIDWVLRYKGKIVIIRKVKETGRRFYKMEIESIKQKVLEDVDPVMKKKKAKERRKQRLIVIMQFLLVFVVIIGLPFFYGDIDS